MAPRLEFQNVLEKVLGSKHVYFQPPPNIQMVYPCIVYQREADRVNHAANAKYMRMKRYSVTVIDPNPDSIIPDKVAALPLSTYNRFYVADNLNHDVFSIYF
jgi:hypothetical protein